MVVLVTGRRVVPRWPCAGDETLQPRPNSRTWRRYRTHGHGDVTELTDMDMETLPNSRTWRRYRTHGHGDVTELTDMETLLNRTHGHGDVS